ncbi:MAG: site-specific integrase, partial [Bacteroidetes bacterium]
PRDRQHRLLDLFTQHNARIERLIGIDYAPATYQRYRTTLYHLRRYPQQRGQEDLPVEEIDGPFVNDFDYYLRTERQCNNNTTVKYLRNLHKIILQALRQGWITQDPFIHYQGRKKTVDRPYLDQAELDALTEKTFPIPRLAQIRDIFLFACYTGLAYIDVAQLTPEHLSRHVDGSWWIRTQRQKTKTPSLIPVLPQAQTLIDRYRDHPEALAQGTLLPVKSNQKTNAYLKEIADLCGITKKLTFHVARHTFATTVTLSNGVPIETVSAMLGHRSIQTTQHYARIVQRKAGEDMKALEEKLARKSPPAGQIKKLS